MPWSPHPRPAVLALAWVTTHSLRMDVSSPDEKSVITYVSSLYDAFPKVPEGGEGIGANVSIDFSILKLITHN